MIAGILMMIISVEITPSWAYLTFFATGILAAFVTFDKEAALLYIMLFGHYPVTKQFIDRIKPVIFRIAVKLAVFNACILSEFYITVKFLGITEFYDQLHEKGKPLIISILLIINVICMTYDYSLEGMMVIYQKKIKPRLIRSR